MNGKLLCFILFLTAIGHAQKPASANAQVDFELHDAVFVVRMLSPISTRTGHEGDIFAASVDEPRRFLGAIMEGRITRIKKTKKGTGKGKAELQFQFETLTFNRQTARIKAELTGIKNSQGKEKVDEEGHIIGVTSNKKRLAGAILGSGLGAAVGAAAGGGRGAAVGATVGLGLGLVIAMKMTTAASEIEFKPGSLFTLTVSDSNKK